MGIDTRKTIHDAVDCSKITAIHKPGEITQRSYKLLQEAYEDVDIPVDMNKIGVAEVDFEHPVGKTSHGAASAFGCGKYRYGNMYWEVEKTPKGYIMLLNRDTMVRLVKHRQTVRHELAHIVNFETEGYTVEREGIHSEWMDRLDAY